MKRSACVTVIAILSLIGSAFMLLIGVLFVLVALLAPMPGASGNAYPPVFFKAVCGFGVIVIAVSRKPSEGANLVSGPFGRIWK